MAAQRPALSSFLRSCFDDPAPEDSSLPAAPGAAAPELPLEAGASAQSLYFATEEAAGARLLQAFSLTLAYRALCWHLRHFGQRLAREGPELRQAAARISEWLSTALEWSELAWPYSVFTPGANPNYSPPLPRALLAPRAAPGPPQPALHPGASSPAPPCLPQHCALRHAGPAYTRITPLRCVAAAAWPHHLPFLATLQPMLVPSALCARSGPLSAHQQALAGFPHPLTAAVMVARRCEELRRSAPGVLLRPRAAAGASGEPPSETAGLALSREAALPDRWRPLAAWWAEDGAMGEDSSSGSSSGGGSSSSGGGGGLGMPRSASHSGGITGHGFFTPPAPQEGEENPFAGFTPLRIRGSSSSSRGSPMGQQASSPSPPSSTSPSSPPSASPLPAHPAAASPGAHRAAEAQARPAAAAAAAAPPSPAAIAEEGAAAFKLLWGAPEQAALREQAEVLGEVDCTVLVPCAGLPHQVWDCLRAHLEGKLYAAAPELVHMLFTEAAEQAGSSSSSSSSSAAALPQDKPSPQAPQIRVPRAVSAAPLLCNLAAAALASACCSTATPTPAAKLTALLAASQVLDRAIRMVGGGGVSGADDLLPAQVWVLLEGCPGGFLHTLSVLEQLVGAGAAGVGGQAAYVLTTWRVAAQYIEGECRGRA